MRRTCGDDKTQRHDRGRRVSAARDEIRVDNGADQHEQRARQREVARSVHRHAIFDVKHLRIVLGRARCVHGCARAAVACAKQTEPSHRCRGVCRWIRKADRPARWKISTRQTTRIYPTATRAKQNSPPKRTRSTAQAEHAQTTRSSCRCCLHRAMSTHFVDTSRLR